MSITSLDRIARSGCVGMRRSLFFLSQAIALSFGEAIALCPIVALSC
ncbi:hypothetical protein [Aerosakkonema funiforme]|uniref:Uncharacterized protein n=1 Tax=Aerosakkonema funiforme FACHB-1375 TaxID=2949571 RepID=A0A926ZFN1_9CYAN|nr:hypothetical protein [Aerosakkonema funiforme]MBD2180262.1 hypothetical protein [Aerosakkonema funiforme FACHB-1375]